MLQVQQTNIRDRQNSIKPTKIHQNTYFIHKLFVENFEFHIELDILTSIKSDLSKDNRVPRI